MGASPSCNGKHDKDKDDNEEADKYNYDKDLGWVPVQTVMENMIEINMKITIIKYIEYKMIKSDGCQSKL